MSQLALTSPQEAVSGMQAAVDEAAARWTNPNPRVLEAGCGSLERVHFGPDVHVVGMDIEAIRVENNASIDEGIVGDVEQYDFPPNSYDAVVCWYVFEHLKDPLSALVRFAGAVKPGGIVVLAFPNLLSPKGLVTKFTPFWFHVFFRRRILRRPNAGTPGHAPYPTTLPFSMTPTTLLNVARASGLEVIYSATHEDDKQQQFRAILHLPAALWRLLVRGVERVTDGRMDAEKTEIVLVLGKPEPAAA
jgi:SAM-dependent methyltransferase